MKSSLTWSWTPDEEQSLQLMGVRGDRALLEAFREGWGQLQIERPSLSRSQLQLLADQGSVRVHGAPVNSTELGKVRVQTGESIEIQFSPPRTLEVVAEDLSVEILFEDEHLVVVNKPQGMSTHPSDTEFSGTLVNALLHHVKDLSGIGGVLRPGIVHRLDKQTSGALVVAKSDLAHQRLVETFARHDIERRYWALCYGKLSRPAAYKIETWIGRNPHDRKKMAILDEGSGKKAITHVHTLQTYGNSREPHSSWVEAHLETGRTHQVRVHLTHQGASIIGDAVYGTPTPQQAKYRQLPHAAQLITQQLTGQALHARILGFKHPVTGSALYFEANPPAIFTELQKALLG